VVFSSWSVRYHFFATNNYSAPWQRGSGLKRFFKKNGTILWMDILNEQFAEGKGYEISIKRIPVDLPLQ